MKTREIEVWLDPDHVEQIKRGHLSQFNNGIYFSAIPVSGTRAKLIIEIPPKKIELTESDLIDAFNYAWENSKVDDYEGTREKLKQKLFK